MPAGVGISFIEKFASSDPHTTTTSATTTTDSTILVAVCSDVGAPTTVSDNKGNGNYTFLGTQQISGFGDRFTSYYYKESALGGAAHTWTADYSSVRVGLIAVQEITGSAPYLASTFAQRNDAGTNPQTLATAEAVTVDGIAVMFCMSQESGTGTFTANDGYTKTAENTAGAVAPGCCAFVYKLVSSLAVQTGSITESATEAELLIAGFGPPPPAPRIIHPTRSTVMLR